MKIRRFLAYLCVLLLLGGCAKDGGRSASTEAGTSGTTSVTSAGNYTVEYKAKDTDATVEEGAKTFTLSDDGITFDGGSSLATVAGSVITIRAGGTYRLTGSLSNGQIVVDEPENEAVRLVLDGVDITCADSAPLYVRSAKKVVLVLTEGSENTLTDGETYQLADAEAGEPNAAVFSKSDLTITGTGALRVNARYNNGINSKDKLKITGGDLTVDAVGNGIKGKDCVAIADGHITVMAGHDGVKSSNSTDADAGFVRIDGGTLTVTAAQDGIQAETGLVVTGGMVQVTSGGGSANASTSTGDGWGAWGGRPNEPAPLAADSDATSAKGLKAGVDIAISGGTVTVDSADDAVHANGNVAIAGGTLALTSGDDGVHADNTLCITDGDLTVSQSYEGLEALVIEIDGGHIAVTASDDGINAAGGRDGSSLGGRPGQNGFAATEGASVTIRGGYTVLRAGGDGLDSNNTITMTGGTVLVYGPTDNGNGAIDYETGFTMTGGTLVAAGSSGMAETISDGTAHAVFVACASQAAGTPVRVEDSDGGEVITVAPEKAFSSVVIVTPALNDGATYTVTIGGSCDGEVTDGVYSGGSYTAGDLSATVTLSGVSTTVNLGGTVGGFGGGRPNDGGFGGGRPGGRPDGHPDRR